MNAQTTTEESCLDAILGHWDEFAGAPTDAPLISAEAFQHLVTRGSWVEIQPDAVELTVSGELWRVAIQAALEAHGRVFLPAREVPYYLDAPLILRSGQQLHAAPAAEIRLKPGTNTCMVRNDHIVSGQAAPVPGNGKPDRDIVIEGGIWTTLATSPSQSHGNIRGCADTADSVPGAHGTILLHNVERVRVRNLTIKECRPFGIQIGNASDFLIENICFENQRRDGVHVEGPAFFGVIRGLHGVTGDDIVALNSWDWKHYSITFGPIAHILVDGVDVTGTNLFKWASNIRLLAGTKTFAGGEALECDIENCVIQNIRGIRMFQMFDQPNLELGRDNDFADPIGAMRNIFFNRIHLASSEEAAFQVASNVDGLSICHVEVLSESSIPALVQIGPLSETYRHGSTDPAKWVEIYSPDKDCTVRNLRIDHITPEISPDLWVKISEQKPNPDYPRTTPRGGTGKGRLLESMLAGMIPFTTSITV